MAKPTDVPLWAETGDVVEPNGSKRDLGWVTGEPAPAQYFNWWQRLTGRWIEWLEGALPEDGSRIITVSPHAGQPEMAAGVGLWTGFWYEYISSRGNFAKYMLPVSDLLPRDCTLEGVRALVVPGAARTGTDRMEITLYSRDMGAWPGNEPTAAQLFQARDDGTTGRQYLGLAMTVPVDRANDTFVAVVSAGSTGGADSDRIYGWEIEFSGRFGV